MKNYTLLIGFILLTNPLIAQKNKIIGKWIIVNEARRDTIDKESDYKKEPWDEYNTIRKVLDTKYIDRREDIIDNQQKWILTIKKEKDYFRAKSGKNLNKKINYDLENQNYWTVTIDSNGTENKLILQLYNNNNTLQIIDTKRKYIVSEFKRSK